MPVHAWVIIVIAIIAIFGITLCYKSGREFLAFIFAALAELLGALAELLGSIF